MAQEETTADAQPDAANVAPGDAPASVTQADPIEEILVRGASQFLESEREANSVVTFEQEDLRAQGTTDIRGLSLFTPNLEIKSVFAASNPTLFIRGVGLKDYFANAASAVAVWNDGQYMNSPTGQLFQLFDVGAIEVLRGPNGTTYGRNATAGVIRVSSQEPTGDFAGGLDVSYGSYDLVELRGVLDVPVVEDTLSTRFAFSMNQRDGVMENRCASSEFMDVPQCRNGDNTLIPPGPLEKWVNDVDNWAARGLFKYEPGGDLVLLARLAGGKNRSLATQFQKVGTRQFGLGLPNSGRDTSAYRDRDLTQFDTSVLDGDPYAGDFNRTGDENVDLFDGSLRATWSLGDWSFQNVAGYAENRRSTEDNADANPFIQLQINWFNKAWQAVDDLRATWDPGENYTLTLGGWFLYEKLEANNLVQFNPSFKRRQLLDQTDVAYAFYTTGTYAFSEDVSAEAGVRYNWDRKDFRSDGKNLILGAPERQLDDFPQSDESIFDGVSGTLELKYMPTEAITLYGKYTRGFKAGQYNGSLPRVDRIGDDTTAVIEAVDSETVDGFEAGIRSSWFDDRVYLGGALFYQRYQNQQVFQLENSDAGLPVPTLLNAGESVMMGVEGEIRVTPEDWISVSSNFGVLESEYLDFDDQIVTQDAFNNTFLASVDYSGNPMVNAPKFSWSGDVQLRLPIGPGLLVPRFDFAYRSQVYFDPNEGRGQFGTFPKSTLGQDDLWLFNLRVGYLMLDEIAEVAFFVRNLTDETYLVDGFDLSSGFDSLTFVVGDRRIIGASLGFHW